MKTLLILAAYWGLGWCAGSLPTCAQPADQEKNPSKTGAPNSLFNGNDPLTFTLVADYQAILKGRNNQTVVDYPATLAYVEADHDSLVLPVQIRIRGNFRRDARHCKFPPLLLDFDKQTTKDSPFERHAKLKLITHCQNEEYVVREYMVYKLYNLLTDYSFRSRLAKVTYRDIAGKRDTETRYAFLLEDEATLARRNEATLSKQKQLRMAATDSLQMATVAVFEYLIGNTDWSVPYRHNIRLLSSKKHPVPMPVPYDFDHAGIVEASYALPAEQLGIQTVRERLYRGYQYSDQVFEQVFQTFRKHKAEIYTLYQNQHALSPAYVKRTLRYIDEFYRIIDRPSLVKVLFVDKGRQNAAGGIVIKGLK
ncbi:hypothetical protein HNV11_12510 [Spirosoma taeanense]|uniref:Uncharacterized protein n=1 Tax=Spirosoma taeanense TaxID=2735870 RepID=A0A6M5YA95_9BACT|nr:hypothetical protein [Spirosoma taeanense]QJW90141.1 hypothetical protein HNV11_12510 [Spirosoma taeanense]